jgi:hypothetical protein
MATAAVSEASEGGGGPETLTAELRGDGLDDLRQGLRCGRSIFSAGEMLRALSLLDEVELRLHAVTRPEAIGFRQMSGVPHVVLRCRACQSEFTGATQTEWLTLPPAPCE